VPSLRDSLDFPHFTQDLRPGLTYVAAPRLGDWRILLHCSPQNHSVPLHSSGQNHSAPLRAPPQSYSARPLSSEYSSHDIDLTCALERVLFEKAPAPARVFFGLLRFFFQINLEDVNLVEFGIEDTRHNHAAALESVHEVRAIQPIDIFSGRQH